MNMAPSPEPEDVLPPVNRNPGQRDAAAAYLEEAGGSGRLPGDRFRDRPAKVQMQGVTPQQYASALALPDPPVREVRLGGAQPPAGALLTDAAARVVAQRLVEMEDRIRSMEDASSRQGTLEARLAALERRQQGTSVETQVARSAVDDEARRAGEKIAQLAAELDRVRRENGELRMRHDAVSREVMAGAQAVRDLQAQLAQLAQVNNDSVRGSQDMSRQRFLALEQGNRETRAMAERVKAMHEALRGEVLDSLSKIGMRVESGEGAVGQLRDVELESMQATTKELSKLKSEVARVEGIADAGRRAALQASEALRVEVEKIAGKIAAEEARSDSAVRSALSQSLSATDAKVARLQSAMVELAAETKGVRQSLEMEMAKRVEAIARAMAQDQKAAAGRFDSADRRIADAVTLAHRLEDDLTKRVDRAGRDQLRVLAELRTLVEAIDHKGQRQTEQVVGMARSLVADLEEAQERRRRQMEDVVRMEIQARVRADDQVKQAAARGLREVRNAAQAAVEMLGRDLRERLEHVRQAVDQVAADHLLEESLVRVECSEQVQGAEQRLRAGLAEAVRGAEQRIEAAVGARAAAGSLEEERVVSELEGLRGVVDSLRATAEAQHASLDGKLDRAHDELARALERAAKEWRSALQQERGLREQGDHDLRMEMVRGDSEVLGKMEATRTEQRAAAERHVRATADHFRKASREQSDAVARLGGALEASTRSLEGQVQVLELDLSRVRGQLDAVGADVTRTRGALFEAVEEAMGRHAKSVGEGGPGGAQVGDVVRLATEVRGVCETLEAHVAQRLGHVELRLAEVDRRSRQTAAGAAPPVGTDALLAGTPGRGGRASDGGDGGLFATPASPGREAPAGLAPGEVAAGGVLPNDELSTAIREIRDGAAYAEAQFEEMRRRMTFEEREQLAQLGSAEPAGDDGATGSPAAEREGPGAPEAVGGAAMAEALALTPAATATGSPPEPEPEAGTAAGEGLGAGEPGPPSPEGGTSDLMEALWGPQAARAKELAAAGAAEPPSEPATEVPAQPLPREEPAPVLGAQLSSASLIVGQVLDETLRDVEGEAEPLETLAEEAEEAEGAGGRGDSEAQAPPAAEESSASMGTADGQAVDETMRDLMRTVMDSASMRQLDVDWQAALAADDARGASGGENLAGLNQTLGASTHYGDDDFEDDEEGEGDGDGEGEGGFAAALEPEESLDLGATAGAELALGLGEAPSDDLPEDLDGL